MLRNVLYTGQVSHHGNIYPGEHEAIIDRQIWDASQALLDRSEPRPRTGHVAMLGGMIKDGHGRRMTSAHANKGNRRYLYYVSAPAADQAGEAWRLPAGDVDALVSAAVLGLLRDPVRLAAEYGDVSANARLAPACADWADRLRQPAAIRAALQQLDAAAVVGADRINVELSARELVTLLRVDGLRTSVDQRIELTVETSLKRHGHELRLVSAAPEANPPAHDDRLIKLIASGHAAYAQLLAGEGPPGTTERSHLVRLAQLRFLVPDIITAIVHGRQPVDLTSRALLRISEMPLAWADQRRVLGFASTQLNYAHRRSIRGQFRTHDRLKAVRDGAAVRAKIITQAPRLCPGSVMHRSQKPAELRQSRPPLATRSLGSGLIDHSQKMTVAARATAEKKTVGQRS